MANTGAEWSGAMITRKPLSRVVSVNSTLGSFDCAKAAALSASSHAHSSGLIRTLFTEHLNVGIDKKRTDSEDAIDSAKLGGKSTKKCYGPGLRFGTFAPAGIGHRPGFT